MKARVITDLVSDALRTEGMVGQGVELLKLLPSFTAVTLQRVGCGKTVSLVRYPVYLAISPVSRVYKKDPSGLPYGDPVEAKISAKVDGVLYEGNELFSPEEVEVSDGT